MNIAWRKLSEKSFKVGYRKMVTRTYQLPNGFKDDFAVVDPGKSAVVVPVTDHNTVIMIKIFRPGPDKVLTEFPGGFLEENEDPMKGAARELAEETGYQGEMIFLGTNYNDAYSTTLRYNYIALGCALNLERKPKEDEEVLEIVELSFDEFKKVVLSGELTNPEAGYMALNYLKL